MLVREISNLKIKLAEARLVRSEAPTPTPTPTADSTGAASVDPTYHWLPVSASTPRGTKLQLINRADGVAQYGHYTPGSAWTHYALLPTFAAAQDAAPTTSPDSATLFKRIDELTAQNSDLRKRWDAAQCQADKLTLLMAQHHLSAARWKTVALAYHIAYTPDGHNSPDDCFATGHFTGDPLEDLVACPGCRAELAFAAADAIDHNHEGEHPA